MRYQLFIIYFIFIAILLVSLSSCVKNNGPKMSDEINKIHRAAPNIPNDITKRGLDDLLGTDIFGNRYYIYIGEEKYIEATNSNGNVIIIASPGKDGNISADYGNRPKLAFIEGSDDIKIVIKYFGGKFDSCYYYYDPSMYDSNSTNHFYIGSCNP